MVTSSQKVDQPTWVPTAVLGAMVVACLLSGYLLTGLAVDHYVVPAPDGGTTAMTHTYPERVVLAALAWLTALLAGVALMLSLLKRRVSRVLWIVLIAGTFVALNAALIISALPAPSY